MSRINLGFRSAYRENAKKKIITAALDVAAEQGWEAVTLDAIARNVGVTKPALYTYFKNREALLRDVTLEVVRNIQTGLETILTSNDDILRIIQRLAKLLFEQQKSNASIFFQLPARMGLDSKNREEFITIFNNSWMVIRDWIARMKSQEKLSRMVDPDVGANMIIAMTMGILTSSDFLQRDVDEAKKNWIDAVQKLLLIAPGV